MVAALNPGSFKEFDSDYTQAGLEAYEARLDEHRLALAAHIGKTADELHVMSPEEIRNLVLSTEVGE